MTGFSHRHLLCIAQLSAADINSILDTAEAFAEVAHRPVRKVPTLRGKTVMTVFYEASTRTRVSFELAAKRLSADLVNVSVATSSVKKGESLRDTCATLMAMHPDLLVLRHPSSGAAHFVASEMDCSVINAGDGMHAHPTQALLDALVLRRRFGRLSGLKVAICGDALHSRVARSTGRLLQRMGSEVRLVGPRTLVPGTFAALGFVLHHELAAGLRGVDAVIGLRVQRERLSGSFFGSDAEYHHFFGLQTERLQAWAPEAAVLHPGPMNRGVEIESTLADGAQSLIQSQVSAGVAVRMALFYLLAGDPR
ncbi:MAG: aspartate carbamoyltransferase catalytic subunit [Polyangiales bacterium]